jgi:hypothetical protein
MANALIAESLHLRQSVMRSAAWQAHRNQRGAPIDWRFINEKARIKLTRLYPKF